MVCHDRGMALVSVLFMLAVLLISAHLLAEKIWQSTRQVAAAARRDQVFWAAQAGVEWARQRLAEGYVGSGGWREFLVGGAEQGYPDVPSWTEDIQGLPVEIYLRDNLDGDGDPRRDSDLKIFVLVRSRGPHGEEVLVECLCGLDELLVAGAWPQPRPDVDLAELLDLPINSYEIGE